MSEYKEFTCVQLAKGALERGNIGLVGYWLEQDKKGELYGMFIAMKAAGEIAPDAPFADGEYALCRVCEGYHDHRNHEVEKAPRH